MTTTEASLFYQLPRNTGKILLNRIDHRKSMRKDRGTIDMIFTARQLPKKREEQNVDLYMTFVDLTKAFDTVSREKSWPSLAVHPDSKQ